MSAGISPAGIGIRTRLFQNVLHARGVDALAAKPDAERGHRQQRDEGQQRAGRAAERIACRAAQSDRVQHAPDQQRDAEPLGLTHRLVLQRTGAYRHIWHPALFNLASRGGQLGNPLANTPGLLSPTVLHHGISKKKPK